MGDAHPSVVGPVPDRQQQVEQVIAVFTAHDAATDAAFLHPEAIVPDPSAPQPLRGRTAIHQDAQLVVTGMPDIMLEVQEQLVEAPGRDAAAGRGHAHRADGDAHR